jgi:hypothetical protein
MSEVSNKTLASLLVLAIVASLGGTLLVLNQEAPVFLTGFATTQTGNVTVNVTQVTAIQLNVAEIDFGQISVDDTVGSTCTVNTNGGTASAACNNNSAIPTNGLQIENTGNVDADILFNSTNSTVTLFLGSEAAAANGQYNVSVNNFEASSCNNFGFLASADNSSAVSSVDEQNICELNFEDANDVVEVDVQLVIPSATAPGVKRDQIVFTATAV